MHELPIDESDTMATQGAYVPLDMRHAIITMRHMYRGDFENIAEVTGITAKRARSIYKNCTKRALSSAFKDVLACASHADIWCEDEDAVKPRYELIGVIRSNMPCRLSPFA